MKINVFVSNLAKYNNGELNGQWTTLPVGDVNKDILDKIDLGGDSKHGYHDEWFISDYEAPFKIGEYTDLYQLNELAKALEDYDTIKDVFDSLEDQDAIGLDWVEPWDNDEVVNTMFEQACAMCNEKPTPANVITHDLIENYSDEYIYLNDLAQVKSMSEYEYKEMFKDNANEIIDQFKEENL